MSLESIIETYGYWAVLVGTFLEGETVVLLGGFAAHRGYLELPWVIAVAFAGSLFGDQLYFYLGRRHSARILRRFAAWHNRIQRVDELMHRFHTPLILAFRFLYGLRIVAPFAMGMSSIPAQRFVLLNVIGAMAWALLVGMGGYLFGNAMQMIIGDLQRHEMKIVVILLSGWMLIWVLLFVRRLVCRYFGIRHAG
jgi:membrane protein DedA with SNARE-associated domain